MMRSRLVVVWSLLAIVATILVWDVAVAQEVYMPLLSKPGAPDDSLNVGPQRDVAHATSATIPLAGGQVVATGADGTRYTLSIPADALLQTTTITLTPIVQITGLPANRLAGAVEIEPLHVMLFQAATLQIEPAQAVTVTEEYPFAYYGDGQDFHPYPIQPYSEELIFPIGRFEGGYGIAQLSEQLQNASVNAPALTPSDPEAHLRSQIAALIHAERESILQGNEPDPTLWPKVRELLLQYYNQLIKPTLERSKIECEYAEVNMGKALGWLRSMQLLFGDETGPNGDPAIVAAGNEIMSALVESMENCYRKAAAPCLDWEDPQQVAKVLRYYRALLLLGAEGDVAAPADLPECKFVDVQLQNGEFHYNFERDAENGWDTSVHFQFVDDTVSGVGFYYPFQPPSEQNTGPSAIISVTALIDDVWQPVPLNKRFFCRDQKAERLQELVFTFAETEGEPNLPPQLYADNIGCWRWSGTVRNDLDYDNYGPSVPEYYQHTSGEVTLERNLARPYFAFESDGKLQVSPLEYKLTAEGVVDYHERLHHVVDGETTCIQTLNLHLTDPASYVTSNFPALRLPNARFSMPREITDSLGAELEVNAPYTTQGTTCPQEGQSLDILKLPLEGELSTDGKHIDLDETGPLGEGSGTYESVVHLQALRE